MSIIFNISIINNDLILNINPLLAKGVISFCYVDKYGDEIKDAVLDIGENVMNDAKLDSLFYIQISFDDYYQLFEINPLIIHKKFEVVPIFNSNPKLIKYCPLDYKTELLSFKCVLNTNVSQTCVLPKIYSLDNKIEFYYTL